jgi:hypothetical protein
MDQAQELRDLLDAVLDTSTPTMDRVNASHMLVARLWVFAADLATGRPADGAEPDRAASFERARRAALEEVTPNEQP